MNKEQIIKLKDELSTTKIRNENNYYVNIIPEKNFGIVWDIIVKYLISGYDKKIAELEAKVYAYEKIIANSNFAPILKDKEEDKVRSKIRGKVGGNND